MGTLPESQRDRWRTTVKSRRGRRSSQCNVCSSRMWWTALMLKVNSVMYSNCWTHSWISHPEREATTTGAGKWIPNYRLASEDKLWANKWQGGATSCLFLSRPPPILLSYCSGPVRKKPCLPISETVLMDCRGARVEWMLAAPPPIRLEGYWCLFYGPSIGHITISINIRPRHHKHSPNYEQRDKWWPPTH